MLLRIPALVSLLTALVSNAPAMAAPFSDSLSPSLNRWDGSHHGAGIAFYSAQDIIKKLGLVENVEKGYYNQSFEDSLKGANNRSTSTAIYYLLEGKVGSSYWHRVDAVEVWHYYAGAPLTLSLSYNNGSKVEVKILGPDIFNGQIPQVAIKKWQWQSAKSLGNWTLVGTTMAPGFNPDSGFELADPDWTPNGA